MRNVKTAPICPPTTEAALSDEELDTIAGGVLLHGDFSTFQGSLVRQRNDGVVLLHSSIPGEGSS
jgi:hypothetical protein